MKAALLLIDIQKDYFKGGSMEVDGSLGAAGNAKKLLERFRAEKMPVVHIQHIAARPGATFFIPLLLGRRIFMNMSCPSQVRPYLPNIIRTVSGAPAFLTCSSGEA